MRNFKKVIALVLAVALMMSTFTVAFAAETTKADKLVTLGLLSDASAPELAEELTREIGIIIVLKALGFKQADADAAVASPFVDTVGWLAPWANLAYEKGITVGTSATTFGGTTALSADQMITMVARNFGVVVTDTTKAVELAIAAKILPAGYVAPAKFTKGDATDIAFDALSVVVNGERAIDALIAAGKVDKAAAVAVGLVSALPATLEVASVSATNLKEVEVTFNQPVDKASAENKDNYSFYTGVVDSVSLLEGGAVARVTLVDKIANQKANKISVKNVKAGTLTLVEVKDLAFTPVDNTLPTVVSVTALGTKSIKIIFSEPIMPATVASFKLGGTAFYGQPTLSGRELVLKAWDALKVGDHVLTVANVEDYSGLKSLSADFAFTVVEDKTAPVMTEVTATLETLTVLFSEDIDPDSVDNDKVYWKSGDSKVKATGKKSVAGNKWEFYFAAESGKALPSYETLVYVEGIKDYSGNAMTETTRLVKAVVDQTRPEVVEVKVDDDKMGFVVKFSKDVENKSFVTNITVSDKDSKVRSVYSAVRMSDKNKIQVKMYEKLPEGTNTVKVTGIKDATTLANTMLDYSTTISVGDSTSPKHDSTSIGYNPTTGVRRVILAFNEKMDASTLANPANYTVKFAGTVRTLPSDATLTVIQDSKAILIDFPDKIGSATTVFGTIGLTEVTVMGVKDVAGNILDGFTYMATITASQTVTVMDFDSDFGGYKAQVTGLKEIKVKFSQGIAKADKTDFLVAGYVVKAAKADNSSIVVIELEADMATTGTTPQVTVVGTDSKIETVAGGINVIPSAGIVITAGQVWDKVQPKVQLATDVTKLNVTNTRTIVLPFSENLGGTAADYAYDLVVTRDSDNKVLVAGTQYDTLLSTGNLIVITVKLLEKDSKYKVEVKADAKYIRDTFVTAKANFAEAKDALYTVTEIDFANPDVDTAIKAQITTGGAVTLKFTEVITTVSMDAAIAAVKANSGLSVANQALLVATKSADGMSVTFTNTSALSTNFTADVTVSIEDVVPAGSAAGTPTRTNGTAKIIDLP